MAGTWGVEEQVEGGDYLSADYLSAATAVTDYYYQGERLRASAIGGAMAGLGRERISCTELRGRFAQPMVEGGGYAASDGNRRERWDTRHHAGFGYLAQAGPAATSSSEQQRPGPSANPPNRDARGEGNNGPGRRFRVTTRSTSEPRLPMPLAPIHRSAMPHGATHHRHPPCSTCPDTDHWRALCAPLYRKE